MTAPTNDPGAPLLLYEHDTGSGHRLAEARMSSEATLNALSLPMIEILMPALARWEADDSVAAVLLTGAGERAFSAGGDIQALYRAMTKNHRAGAVVDDYPFRFFEQEYRLDYRLHTFPKPLISMGQGVIMGGGLGVFSGARYRIVTESARIAMPEVTIGLFPDAGATWLLRGMPRHLATFVALTGVHMNAAEALSVGIGTHAVATAHGGDVRKALRVVPWRGNAAADHEQVQRYLAGLKPPPLPASRLGDVSPDVTPDGSVLEVVERLRALSGRSKWIDGAIAVMNRGCPASLGIVVEQLERAPALTLAESFRLEMVVATHCANHPDFTEGVRALIIDKDNSPRWRYPSLESLPEAYVAEHFQAPWNRNPLEDLEEQS